MMAYPLLSSTAVAPHGQDGQPFRDYDDEAVKPFRQCVPKKLLQIFSCTQRDIPAAGADIAISNESNTNKGIVSAAQLFNRAPANDCP
jgi:hypothetical protein